MENKCVVEVNGDGAGSESSDAPGVAKLADGNERGVAEGREEMGSCGRGRKGWDVEVDEMGRLHGSGIWEGYEDGGWINAFVVVGRV